MSAGSSYATLCEYGDAQPPSVQAEAIARLRLGTGVSIIAEIILPVIEAAFFPKPDWLTIELQSIWFVFTVILLAATWHPWFARIWKPSVLFFAIALIVSSGILSIKGAMLAPFMFLLVLVPAGSRSCWRDYPAVGALVAGRNELDLPAVWPLVLQPIRLAKSVGNFRPVRNDCVDPRIAPCNCRTYQAAGQDKRKSPGSSSKRGEIPQDFRNEWFAHRDSLDSRWLSRGCEPGLGKNLWP